VPAGASILLPLHPVNRIRGLRPGQSWTLRIFDPLADSLGALQGSGGELRILRAKVSESIQPFNWGRRKEIECLQIHYEGEDMKAITWVGTERGQVVCQEVTFDNQRWVMYRD
jgi:hypothetical protein